MQSSRYLWIPGLIYGIPNVIALVGSAWLGLLLVDMVPVELRIGAGELTIVGAAVAGSFGLLLACARLAERQFVGEHQGTPAIMGHLVFAVQLVSLVAVLGSDYGRVGARQDSVGFLATLASYLKSDLMFLLYYGHVRPGRFPKYNLALYIGGNMLRGWSSIWLILFLIEVYYLLAKQRRSGLGARLFAVAAAVVLLYPTLDAVKAEVRGAQETPSAVDSYAALFNRLQHATNVALVAQDRDVIRSDYAAGRISPWYANDPITSRLVGRAPNVDSLQRYLTQKYLIDVDALGVADDEFAWYTHVGIAGWLFVVEWYIAPIYLAYVALLIWAPYRIIGRYLGQRSMIPVLHVASFIFVLHGWLEVQCGFIAVAAVYVALNRLLQSQRGHQRPAQRASGLLTP